MSDQIYHIQIPNFSKWQRDTDNRQWVAMDTGFFHDPKVLEIMAIKPDTVFIYQWLLMNVDHEGKLTIKESSLKRSLMNILCVTSNRFNILNRFQLLSNALLIEFQCDPNDVLMTSQCSSNDLLMTSQCDPNTPLEPPETQIYEPPITNKQTRQNKHTNIRVSSTEVEVKEVNIKPPRSSLCGYADKDYEFSKVMHRLLKDKGWVSPQSNIYQWAEKVNQIRNQEGLTIEQLEDVMAWVLGQGEGSFWRTRVVDPWKLHNSLTTIIAQGQLHAKWNKEKAHGY